MAGEVEFHTGLDAPVMFACRLLRKALRAGAQVVCTAPPPTLEALDRALWTFEEREFVPHVRVPGASDALLRRTPLWLATAATPAAAGRVLVNLGAVAPDDPAAFMRVIEVVGSEAAEAAAGRERWREYKARGFDIRHHPAGGRAG